MAHPWLAVFSDAEGESCLGAVVAIKSARRAVWIATANHCVDAIASVTVGGSRYQVAATASVFARKVGTDYSLAIIDIPRTRKMPACEPIAIGEGPPEFAIVRRSRRVRAIGVRAATAGEVSTFDAQCAGPECRLCACRMTIVAPTKWRIRDHDSGGPVLSGEKLVGVVSTESLGNTGISSYCPADVPDCDPTDRERWRDAGFEMSSSLSLELR